MAIKPSRAVLFAAVLLLFNFSTYAQTMTFPRLEPDPKARQFYRQGGRNHSYSWSELAEISLWASGDISGSHLERIHTAVTTMNNSGELPASQKEKAEFILEYLHRNILRTYASNSTGVDTIFVNGRYNCVSSAVLYMIFCKSAGINVSPVVTRDHAFVIVHINGEDIDVETTNRFGFDPGNRREFHDQFGRLTGFTYVPAGNYRDRQTITQIELVSMILKNRIVYHERQNRYAEAVPLAIDRAALLAGNSLAAERGSEPSGTIFENPRKELMDRLFNYGAWLLGANREEECLRWAAAASPLFPDEDRWQELIMAAAGNRITRLIRGNNTIEARNFLENSRAQLADSSFIQLEIPLIDAEIVRRVRQISSAAEGDAVISDIIQMRASRKMNERRAGELINSSVLGTAYVLSAPPGRNWRAAIQYIENAIANHGANRELEQALRTYQSNLATDYHNRFAAEWNRRNFDEAERILNEGLREFPDNRQLLSDRDMVNRQRR